MVAVEGGGVRIFKKQFRGYHRGQVDNLLTNMEKESRKTSRRRAAICRTILKIDIMLSNIYDTLIPSI
jgi:hypothetical protein